MIICTIFATSSNGEKARQIEREREKERERQSERKREREGDIIEKERERKRERIKEKTEKVVLEAKRRTIKDAKANNLFLRNKLPLTVKVTKHFS